MRIAEAYFALKSINHTQKQFITAFPTRNLPSSLTIRRPLEKLWETRRAENPFFHRLHVPVPLELLQKMHDYKSGWRISFRKANHELSLRGGHQF